MSSTRPPRTSARNDPRHPHDSTPHIHDAQRCAAPVHVCTWWVSLRLCGQLPQPLDALLKRDVAHVPQLPPRQRVAHSHLLTN